MAITDPSVRELKRYLRNLEKRLLDVDQRVARVIMRGKVLKIREQNDDWQVKLEIGRDPENDKVVEGPWVPVQPLSGGKFKIKVKPTMGELMTMYSPSGVIGTASWAGRGPFHDDHPAPKGSEDLVLEVEKTRLTIKDGQILQKVDETTFELAPKKIVSTSESVKDVGKSYLGLKDENDTTLKAVAEGDKKSPRVLIVQQELEPEIDEV